MSHLGVSSGLIRTLDGQYGGGKRLFNPEIRGIRIVTMKVQKYSGSTRISTKFMSMFFGFL